MNNLTALVITKNEEKMIADCLKSLGFVDRIFVVDAYSKDKTVEIAKKCGAVVINHRFVNFSQMRNFALKQVKTPWVLFIDADERVTTALAREITRAVGEEKEASAFSFIRKNYYFGKEWPYKERVTKLFLKDKLRGYKGEIHESPIIDGEVKHLSGELLHFTHRSLEEMLEKTISWSEFEARLRYKNKHPQVTWWRLIRVFFTGFLDSYIKQKGFLAGSIGLIESLYQGFSMFITYVRLWEIQKGR